MNDVKPPKYKHIAVGQIWKSINYPNSYEAQLGYKPKEFYREIVAKHGSHWECKCIIVTNARLETTKFTTLVDSDSGLKAYSGHFPGGLIVREWQYITNNKSTFIKNYNILYGNKVK